MEDMGGVPMLLGGALLLWPPPARLSGGNPWSRHWHVSHLSALHWGFAVVVGFVHTVAIIVLHLDAVVGSPHGVGGGRLDHGAQRAGRQVGRCRRVVVSGRGDQAGHVGAGRGGHGASPALAVVGVGKGNVGRGVAGHGRRTRRGGGGGGGGGGKVARRVG